MLLSLKIETIHIIFILIFVRLSITIETFSNAPYGFLNVKAFLNVGKSKFISVNSYLPRCIRLVYYSNITRECLCL